VKLLIVYKNPRADSPSACHEGLGVTSSNTADALSEYGHATESFPVVDGFYLRDRLRRPENLDVTHVALSAPFFDTPFLRSLCAEFGHIRFTVVFHSNVGFLGVDNWSTGVLGEQIRLASSVRNFEVSGNSAKFCGAVHAAFHAPCTLLPNLYFLHGPIERKRAPWSPAAGPLRIGAFGATRVLKNLPTAAWAAAIMARRLGVATEFWVSSGREEGSGAGTVMAGIRKLFAPQTGIRLVEAPWASWLDFRRGTVRKMNLLLQPSFTESFNGVTADGIAEGVPSVVGHAIDWVPPNWIANADHAVETAETGLALLRDRHAPRDGYRALARYNERGIASWRRFLQQSNT
jgi:hypothetical protein